MKTVAFITTSKGRLHHLQQTLPLLVGAGASEVIVVDYACPDQSGRWVEQNFPNVRVVRVQDDPDFCLARARNLGAQQASAEWLAFVDADVKVSSDWLPWMQQHLQPGRFYRAGPINGVRAPDTFGSFVCARPAFAAVGGYDEAFRGWGGEDLDIYMRLSFMRQIDSDYPGSFVNAIAHGDDQRTTWAEIKTRKVQAIVNQCYLEAKFQVAAFHGPRRPLSLKACVRLMEQTQKQVLAWHDSDANQPLTLNYTMKGKSLLPAPYAMRRQMTLTVQIERTEGSGSHT